MAPSLRRVSLDPSAVARDGAARAGRPEPPPGWGYLDYPGADLLMRAETAIERAWRLRACAKEPWTAEWLETLGPGDLLVNVGACVGSYALIAAHRGARVVAVEASPINGARLAENAAANCLGERVTLVVAACGPTEEPYGARLGLGQPGAADIRLGEPHPKGVNLPGVTLDGLADVYGQPTHLLIDVDGGELDVLRGGVETLAAVREVLLECATEPRIAEGCERALEAAGLPAVGAWTHRDGVKIEGVFYSLHRRAA